MAIPRRGVARACPLQRRAPSPQKPEQVLSPGAPFSAIRALPLPPCSPPQDCVERPRKKGAKYTGKDIKADEVTVELAYDYAGKRDHWQQFDPAAHMAM